MKQYVIYAYDGTDEQALERRMNARPYHLTVAKALKANGNFIVGGAILDNDGNMIGSTMLVQFESEEALYNWYDNDPYVTMKVWERVEIKPFKVADV
ncbi:MAG: YciI family protein [Flectobacillus sp.]|uniref:YciI family protein n=1 Tax=Flectobacillus sp. TaxID=50419 RepID=UPI003B9ABDFA